MMVATSPLIKSVSLGRVDCTQEKQLCASQQVSAFPTLRVYRQHDTHSHENYHGDRTVEALHEFLQEAVEAVDEAAGFHPLTHLSHRAGEGCQVSGGVLISRVPGSLRISAQSPQAAHSFDPLVMNATHHVDALLFVPPLFDRASDIEWSTQLHSHSLGAISDPGEQPPRARTQTQTHARTPHHPLFCPPGHRRRRRRPPLQASCGCARRPLSCTSRPPRSSTTSRWCRSGGSPSAGRRGERSLPPPHPSSSFSLTRWSWPTPL